LLEDDHAPSDDNKDLTDRDSTDMAITEVVKEAIIETSCENNLDQSTNITEEETKQPKQKQSLFLVRKMTKPEHSSNRSE